MKYLIVPCEVHLRGWNNNWGAGNNRQVCNCSGILSLLAFGILPKPSKQLFRTGPALHIVISLPSCFTRWRGREMKVLPGLPRDPNKVGFIIYTSRCNASVVVKSVPTTGIAFFVIDRA